jgi:hypothetical protein
VSSSLTKVGMGTALVGIATSKLGITTVIAVTAVSLSVGTMINFSDKQAQAPQKPAKQTLKTLLSSKEYNYPSKILRTSDIGMNGWISFNRDIPENNTASVNPASLLLGEQFNIDLSLVIPNNHWIEVLFEKPIIDGPDIDLFIAGWDEANTPRVFITNGVDQEFELKNPEYGGNLFTFRCIGFDLSGLNLSFKPIAILVLGVNQNGPARGYELVTIRARLR